MFLEFNLLLNEKKNFKIPFTLEFDLKWPQSDPMWPLQRQILDVYVFFSFQILLEFNLLQNLKRFFWISLISNFTWFEGVFP